MDRFPPSPLRGGGLGGRGGRGLGGCQRRPLPPAPSPKRGGGEESLPLIPVYPRVVRPPADGDDVRLAVAVQVGDRQVLDRDPAIVDDEPGPLLADAVRRLVEADS